MSRYVVIVIGALALIVGVAACGSSSSSSSNGSSSSSSGSGGGGEIASPIKIGVIGGETGAYAFVGEEQHKGVELAIDEINENGGVEGAEMEFKAYNDNADSSRATTAFQQLVSQYGAIAVMGSGDAGEATAQYTERAEVPDLGIVDGGGPTVYPDGPGTEPLPWVFEYTPSNYAFGAKLAEEAGPTCKSIGLLHDTTTYGEGAKEAIVASLESQGKSLKLDDPITEEWASATPSAIEPEVLKLKEAEIDCVIVWLTPASTAKFAVTAKSNGYTPQIYANDSAPVDPDFARIAGSAGNGTLSANLKGFLNPSPKYEKYKKAFEAKFHEEPSLYAGQSYDAIYTLADAIERAGSTENEALREALDETKAFEGAVDTITFTPEIHESVTTEDLEMVEFDSASGKWVPVEK